MQEGSELLDKLKLSVDEIAFYRALVENEYSVREFGDDAWRKVAIELTKQESVPARISNLVRCLLCCWVSTQQMRR
jgi:type I restriction enzyme R subunit